MPAHFFYGLSVKEIMDNCSINDDEDCKFFDAVEEYIEPEQCSVSDCSFISPNFQYDVWISSPQSVRERRRKFITWMGESPVDTIESSKYEFSTDRIVENGGAVLRTSSGEEDFSSGRSLDSEDVDLCERRYDGGANFSGGNVDAVVEINEDIGLDQPVSSEEFGECSQSSPSVEQFRMKESSIDGNGTIAECKSRSRWLSRLRSMTCMTSWEMEEESVRANDLSEENWTRMQRVKVRHYQRRLKELSALFTGQDIQAHEGSITAMKFSHDGQYLASAGEDMIIKVWQVVEDERSDTIDIPDADPSCIYFSMNHLSGVGPLAVENEKARKSNGVKTTRDSACIVLPSKVFRIIEKPVHVFQGHTGEILDLSWSKNNCLLSSSIDKTVRLWRVGVDCQIKVFPHNDYVTCIQFNPAKDDYFISGSIDGKVRIWQIEGCKVVDWYETRHIITAVAYHPDGQGGIIGSIGGTCCYFSLSDNQLQLGSQMCLSTKKSPCKRITGFQFSPQDPSKVLVTCADSNVRIIDGMNVITKYKGSRSTGFHTSASFSSNGKHIVSASDDSNVYMWNYTDHENPSMSQPKAIWSSESFFSNTSIAIPWPGLKSNDVNPSNTMPFSASTLISLSQAYFCDSTSKVSATWPEEKLLASGPKPVKSPISRSQYRLVKTSCQNSSDSHAWGMVIVAAGWDGRIRSFQNYGLPVSL